jgi:uncharacterized Zn finger protein
MECAFCGVEIPKENVGMVLLEEDELLIKCLSCGTINKIVLEIDE